MELIQLLLKNRNPKSKSESKTAQKLLTGPLICSGGSADIYVGIYEASFDRPQELVAVKLFRNGVNFVDIAAVDHLAGEEPGISDAPASSRSPAAAHTSEAPIQCGFSLQKFDEFCREAEILRKIQHQNVVQYYAALIVQGSRTCRPLEPADFDGRLHAKSSACYPPRMAIILELAHGGDVGTYVKKHNGPLSVPEVLKIGIDTARGMKYLHSLGIVHRDLKPANLLLTSEGTVKVSDFGLARLYAPPEQDLTNEVGTYRYMAPELLMHEPYDASVDVYSFGLTLSEVVTGRAPFADLRPLQAALDVSRKVRPTLEPSLCSSDMLRLIEQCWDHEASNRPTFATIVTSLETFATGHPCHNLQLQADNFLSFAPQRLRLRLSSCAPSAPSAPSASSPRSPSTSFKIFKSSGPSFLEASRTSFLESVVLPPHSKKLLEGVQGLGRDGWADPDDQEDGGGHVDDYTDAMTHWMDDMIDWCTSDVLLRVDTTSSTTLVRTESESGPQKPTKPTGRNLFRESKSLGRTKHEEVVRERHQARELPECDSHCGQPIRDTSMNLVPIRDSLMNLVSSFTTGDGDSRSSRQNSVTVGLDISDASCSEFYSRMSRCNSITLSSSNTLDAAYSYQRRMESYNRRMESIRALRRAKSNSDDPTAENTPFSLLQDVHQELLKAPALTSAALSSTSSGLPSLRAEQTRRHSSTGLPDLVGMRYLSLDRDASANIPDERFSRLNLVMDLNMDRLVDADKKTMGKFVKMDQVRTWFHAKSSARRNSIVPRKNSLGGSERRNSIAPPPVGRQRNHTSAFRRFVLNFSCGSTTLVKE